MLIISKIRRAHGTTVNLNGAVYHFRPAVPGGDHVCEVSIPEHIERFRAIPEGYEVPAPTSDAPAAPLLIDWPVAAPAAPAAPLPEVTMGASALVAPLGDSDAGPLVGDSDAGPPETEPTITDFDAMDEGDLREAYQRRFGRAAHPKAKVSTLRAALAGD